MTLFISDTHLGHKRCNAEKLYNFLYDYDKSETIFLVGDIIDDHQMKDWPFFHIMALHQILKFKKIIYLPGNHDRAFRKVFGVFNDGQIIICNEYLYQTGNGKEYLVTHGDAYDWFMKYTHFVSESWINRIIRKLFENLHTRITSDSIHYCQTLVKVTKDRGYTGVICGHSHYPDITKISGIDYMNCGDWIESCSAITEQDGVFKLIR